MHKEIGRVVNDLADTKGTELTPADIRDAFRREYLEQQGARGARALQDDGARLHREVRGADRLRRASRASITGAGNGPIDAFVRALGSAGLPKFDVVNYSEHSLGQGRGGEGRQLHPDQDGAGRRVLRRRDRHEHRAGVDQGDRERAQPGDQAER